MWQWLKVNPFYGPRCFPIRSIFIQNLTLPMSNSFPPPAKITLLGLTLGRRIWVPGCPQLDDEERRPADSVDQDNDQSHPDRLGHGFSDAGRRHGWGLLRCRVFKWAPVGTWLQFIWSVRLLTIWAAQCRCGCYVVAAATAVLHRGWHIVVTLPHFAVVAVTVWVVINTLYKLSPFGVFTPCRRPPNAVPVAPLLVFLKTVEAKQHLILLELCHYHPLRLQIDVVVNLPEDSYLKR